MKYSAFDIDRMRGIIHDLGYGSAAETERRLLTYMSNETTFDELKEFYRKTNRVAFDYSQWNDTGVVAKWDGNTFLGDEPFDFDSFHTWRRETEYNERGPSYSEWLRARPAPSQEHAEPTSNAAPEDSTAIRPPIP